MNDKQTEIASYTTVIAVNLIPVLGFFLLDWKLTTIILTYLLETSIITLFTLLKINAAPDEIFNKISKKLVIAVVFVLVVFLQIGAFSAFFFSIFLNPDRSNELRFIISNLSGIGLFLVASFAIRGLNYRDYLAEKNTVKSVLKIAVEPFPNLLLIGFSLHTLNVNSSAIIFLLLKMILDLAMVYYKKRSFTKENPLLSLYVPVYSKMIMGNFMSKFKNKKQ